MKHPVTGPRIYAILLIFSAGFVSSKFFSKPVEKEKAGTTASGKTANAEREKSDLSGLAAAAVSTGPGGDAMEPRWSENSLPSWARKHSRLDQFIEAGPKLTAKPSIEAQLEPFPTWTNRQPRAPAAAGLPPLASGQALANHPRSSDISVGFRAIGTQSTSIPEEVEALDVVGQTQPPVADSGLIADYRSSPWESDEKFRHSTHQWRTVTPSSESRWLPPADSTPIRWPDQQIAGDELERIKSVASASSLAAVPQPENPTDTSSMGSIQIRATISDPQVRQTSLSRSKASRETATQANVSQNTLSQNRQDRRFLFQPGIRSRP